MLPHAIHCHVADLFKLAAACWQVEVWSVQEQHDDVAVGISESEPFRDSATTEPIQSLFY